MEIYHPFNIRSVSHFLSVDKGCDSVIYITIW